MKITDFRSQRNVPVVDDKPVQLLLSGTREKPLWLKNQEARLAAEAAAANANPEADDPDEEEDDSFDLDADDMETLKVLYAFLDDMITWILCDVPDIPKDLVKRLQTNAGDVHFLINQFQKFRPTDAGYPDILTTLEDEKRGDIRVSTQP